MFGAVVGVLSENSHINLETNIISGANSYVQDINVIYLNKSVSTQKNNNFSDTNRYIQFAQKNAKSFISVKTIPISGQYIDVLNNSICNFIDLSYNCNFADTYVYGSLHEAEMQNFYIEAQTWMHNAQAISIMSPMFINNGQNTSFSGNENQELLSNIDILIQDYSKTEINKIQNFLNNFPKNLNSYVLNIIFGKNTNTNNTSDELELSFKNFDAGVLKLSSKDKQNSISSGLTIDIDNCSTVEIDNIRFKNNTLNIKNCNNIIFNNIQYWQSSSSSFNVQSSNVLVKNSKIYLTMNDEHYFGNATLNSKVYIHQTCQTYDVSEKLIVDKNIKKFNVTKNSQVTWFTYTDDINRLMNNQDIEFEDKISENFIGSSNSFKNHIHASFALQDIVSNIDEFNSIILSMPVGSTFYWPRAFRFSEYTKNKSQLTQFNWENTSAGINEYAKYMKTYSPELQNYNDIYTSGEIISISKNETFKVTPLIPFVSGAIPLALHSEDGWDSQFENLENNLSGEYVSNLSGLFENTNNFNLSASTATINTCYPSHKYKSHFYYTSLYQSYWDQKTRLNKSIQSKADNFLNLAYLIQHPSGPSERTNRNDQFGGLSIQNYSQIKTLDINTSCITLRIGCTHDMGGNVQTPFNVNSNADGSRALSGLQYYRPTPPHSEYWYARQGIHLVFQVGSIIQIDQNTKQLRIPAYLQNGYLKFSYNFTPPLNNKKQWYGIFMVSDDYRILKNYQSFQEQCACANWPAFRNQTQISFLKPGETNVQQLTGKLVHSFITSGVQTKTILGQSISDIPDLTVPVSTTIEDPLLRMDIGRITYTGRGSLWANKTNYFNDNTLSALYQVRDLISGDYNDVPIYGNYFLSSNGDIYLPINKIAGKYLTFGIRGTYSTNLFELDNNRYTGKYADPNNPGSIITDHQVEAQNTAVIQFYDFRLIPGIMPNVFDNKIQLADRQSFPLKFNSYNNNINAPIGSDNPLIKRDMWRQGGRYYANIDYNTNISYNPMPLSADSEISGRIFELAQNCYNFYKNTVFALRDSVSNENYKKTPDFYTTAIGDGKDIGNRNKTNFINAYRSHSNIPKVGLAVFDKIVSDTILCVKTSENISIAHQNVDRSIPQMSQKKNFWYLSELSNTNINNFLFYTNIKYKDRWYYYNTLQNSPYKCLQDNAIAVACKSSISDITNTTPNSYFISGSPTGTKMGIFNYSNSNGYNFIPSASFRSTQYIGLVYSPAFMFNISGTTEQIQQPNQPISIYNYYWKQNTGEKIGTLLQNTGINYLWNGRYSDNSDDLSLIGFKPMPNKNELSGQWYYHFGLSKYKIAKSLLTFLTVITDSINALPTYFYSPVQDRLQFKYNMGVIGNNVTGAVLPEYDFDMFNEIQDGTLAATNPQQLSGYLISTYLNLNWYSYVSAGMDAFGVYDQHIGLRRSKGLAWPLYDVTKVSGYILNELNEKVYDYIPSTLNRYNFDKIFFELPDGISEISSATPELFNIKLITTNLDTNKFTKLTIGQKEYPVSGMYDKISYPSILSSTFILEEEPLLHGQKYNTILQDLDDLNTTNIYVFNVNKFFNTIISAYNNQEKKVSLTKTTTIVFNENIDTAIGIINGTNLSNSTIKFSNDMILNNPSITNLTRMLNNNRDLLSKKPFVVCTTQIPGGNGSNVSGVVESFDNKSFTIYYGKLSYVAGSLAEEYRETDKKNVTIKSTANTNTVSLKYDSTYEFKNFADILLFYINAKSYINYFMIKFNKLFNHITNYNYNTNTNKLTISSFNDTFENPDNYVNAYTAYVLASYSNLNDTAIWKAFAYNDLYSEVTGNFNYNRNLLYNYPVISPYNTMAWTNSKNHSKVLGQHYPINSKNIYEYNTELFDWFNKYLDTANWKDISGNATIRKQQAYNYTISSEHMMSFYRPFYLEFKNMFNSIDWSMEKLDDLEYNEVPQSETFTSKCFNCGFINISKLMYSKNTKKYQEVIGKCINYNAFNKDYGWFDNNFTFDSIIQPDLDNLQFIALNNTKLSSTLSAGLLQPSLTKQQIYGLNRKILTTTLVLDLANNNDKQYILSSNMITVLSGHLYKNGVLGMVYYQNDMGNNIDHTEIYNGTTSEYLTLTGPSANISYSPKNKHLIQYSFFDKLQFNNIPNYTIEIHLSQIISDISNNSIFASNLNLQNIKEITLSKSTINASYAFNGISSMINIPTSLIIPDTCTDMQYMFNDCIRLTNLNNFNLGISISSANGIFKRCESIIKLRTNNTQFVIPKNVVTANQLFEGCKKLYIQQNQFNIKTNILSSCNRMFKDCLELDKIPFILPKSVVNCSGMFENDEKIPLIPEGFKFHDGLINTNSMFKNCDSISSIPIWFSQTTTIKDIGSMFEGMHNIFKLDNTYTLPTSVINAENLFRDCANVVDLDVDRFLSGMLDNKYNENIRLSGMFAECSILTGTISNKLISALVELPSAQVLGMFAKCVNLTNYIEMPYILTLEENN